MTNEEKCKKCADLYDIDYVFKVFDIWFDTWKYEMARDKTTCYENARHDFKEMFTLLIKD